MHFACQQCGSCCSGPDEGVIWISRPEINMLAEHLGLSTSELRKKHLKRIGFRFSIKENPCSKDCVFLVSTNGSRDCAIYNFRPMQCRNWPFWPANLQSPDDWNTAAKKCPGINKGRLYSFDEIRKIKKQKYWWNNDKTAPICSEVKKIYDWLDSNIKPLNNKCDACGKCCYFDSFGHKLFVTTPELLYFYENVKPLRKMTGSCCPYLENGTLPHQFILQKANLKEHLKQNRSASKILPQNANWCGGKCNARNYRFAGCRIFFCKSAGGCLTAADKDMQNRLSEESIEKFKALCDKFNLPYRYIDLATALNSERNQ